MSLYGTDGRGSVSTLLYTIAAVTKAPGIAIQVGLEAGFTASQKGRDHACAWQPDDLRQNSPGTKQHRVRCNICYLKIGQPTPYDPRHGFCGQHRQVHSIPVNLVTGHTAPDRCTQARLDRYNTLSVARRRGNAAMVTSRCSLAPHLIGAKSPSATAKPFALV